MPESNANPEQLKQEFSELFHSCERELFTYIYGLTASHSSAADVLQDTAVRLWQNFSDFDHSRPFGTWARKFAHTEVLKSREKGKYRQWMMHSFDETTISHLAWEHELHEGVLDLRKTALKDCLKKLDQSSIELLRQRYWYQTNLRKLSRNQQVSENQIYRRLSNIRLMLQECINARLGSGGDVPEDPSLGDGPAV